MAVVIDNGSNTIKVGFGGEETPQNLIPTRIGRPIRYGTEVAGIDSNCYVGKQVMLTTT
jgi:actin-related protein